MSELASPPRLMDRVRATIQARHSSRRTEETYAWWIKRYIFFEGEGMEKTGDWTFSAGPRPAVYPPRVRLQVSQPIPPRSLEGTRARLHRRFLGCCSLIQLRD